MKVKVGWSAVHEPQPLARWHGLDDPPPTTLAYIGANDPRHPRARPCDLHTFNRLARCGALAFGLYGQTTSTVSHSLTLFRQDIGNRNLWRFDRRKDRRDRVTGGVICLGSNAWNSRALNWLSAVQTLGERSWRVLPTSKGANIKYLFEPRGDDYFGILNDDSDCYVGYVALRGARYHVQNDDNEEIAVVKSLDDAIPALAAYYEENPPRWKCESKTRYSKLTQFGPLRVEQVQPGQWVAYRNDDYPLLREGKPATFATSEEAQRAADAHAPEGYPNSETIYDGFAWLPDPDPWCSYPNRVAVRTRWAASHA